MRVFVRWSPRLTLSLLLLTAIPGLAASQTGTIAGRVVDSGTQAPLGAAQIQIESLGIGVLSQASGQFQLPNVPAGTHTVRVQRLGYGTVSQSITVAAGAVATLNFALPQTALALDAVVVTGTAGGSQVRAIGNVVGRLDADRIREIAPVGTMQDLIGRREPGVAFNRSTGNIGGGSSVRIRGTSSFSLGDQPLLYVDGVRVDNQAGVGPSGLWGGPQASRLDDFSPNEIESIEIIKGAAAATLYGTEASAGVIQIITKKGQIGRPQFDFTVRQGANWLPNPARMFGDQWGIDRATGEVISFNIVEEEAAAGRPIFSTGHAQLYSLSMRGGTDFVRYFLSTEWKDETGMFPFNWDRRSNMRANVTVMPHETLSLDISSAYLDGATNFLSARVTLGAIEQTAWANPALRNTPQRGFFVAPPSEFNDVDALREFTRFTGGATLTHTPWERFTHRLTAGLDVNNDHNRVVFPRHPEGSAHLFGVVSLGEISVERPTVRAESLDYSASLRYRALHPELTFTSSFGAQYFSRQHDEVRVDGRVFPTPAVRNLAGATTAEWDEVQFQNKGLGMYLQQEVGFDNRIFATAAVRGDDNSAFGAEFEAAIYPKLSATWVVSDESFWRWHSLMNQFRLRTAWGQAGRQPETFAAVTLYAPELAVGSEPGVRPSIMGNPDVGPEVTTELEAGFDAALLGDRVSGQFTYYTQKVTDAILSMPLAPSHGFPGSQSVNIGQLSNWGWEVALDARLYESRNFAIEMGGALARNENRIDDLGGRPPTAAMREGIYWPNVHLHLVRHAEWANQPGGAVTNVLCDGGTPDRRPGGESVPCRDAPTLLVGGLRPLYEGSVNGTIRLLDNLRLFGSIDGRWGRVWMASSLQGCRTQCSPNSEKWMKRDDPVYVAHWAIPGLTPGAMSGTYRADFIKLRELSLNYRIPTLVTSRVGANNSSVLLAARNLGNLWVKQKEIGGNPIIDREAMASFDGGAGVTPVPPLRSVLVTLRVAF
jgi:TonB-dependent starch-binding outer membrane protein SusC